MASVLYGAMVSELAGKIGGQNFQRGLASPTIRNISTKRKKFNVVPVAQAIPTIRALFHYVTASWRSLTLSQQSAWRRATSLFPRTNKFGTSYTPSAYQLFVEFNLSLKYLGHDLEVSAPTVSTFVVPTWSIAYAGGGGSITISQSVVYTSSPYETVIRACVYQSAGKGLVKSRLKVLAAFQFTSVASSLVVSTSFYNTFGPAVTGTVAFFTVNQVNVLTGEQGPSTTLSVSF